MTSEAGGYHIPEMVLKVLYSPESIADMDTEELMILRDDMKKLYLETAYREFDIFACKLDEMLKKLICALPEKKDNTLGISGEDPIF